MAKLPNVNDNSPAGKEWHNNMIAPSVNELYDALGKLSLEYPVSKEVISGEGFHYLVTTYNNGKKEYRGTFTGTTGTDGGFVVLGGIDFKAYNIGHANVRFTQGTAVGGTAKFNVALWRDTGGKRLVANIFDCQANDYLKNKVVEIDFLFVN